MASRRRVTAGPAALGMGPVPLDMGQVFPGTGPAAPGMGPVLLAPAPVRLGTRSAVTGPAAIDPPTDTGRTSGVSPRATAVSRRPHPGNRSTSAAVAVRCCSHWALPVRRVACPAVRAFAAGWRTRRRSIARRGTGRRHGVNAPTSDRRPTAAGIPDGHSHRWCGASFRPLIRSSRRATRRPDFGGRRGFARRRRCARWWPPAPRSGVSR